MKRKLVCAFLALACLAFAFAGCGTDSYVLNEDTFFLVMTNMQYYPEQYVNKHIEYDCFVYHLTDVEGNVHVCAVRKCSAEYGCQCGNDTVIGFVLVALTLIFLYPLSRKVVESNSAELERRRAEK